MAHSTQKGNVLFYILIAVALFAALSYAVGRNERGSYTGSQEQLKVKANQIIRYGADIKRAVDQIRSNGYSENDISFDDPALTGYENPNCTENGCKVFKVQGGGAVYQEPNESWLDGTNTSETLYGEYYFTTTAVNGVGSGFVGYTGQNTPQGNDDTNDEDLVMTLAYVDTDLCRAINDVLEINQPAEGLPRDSGQPFKVDGSVKFVGEFVETNVIDSTETSAAQQFGKFAACIRDNNSGYNFFYQVLVAR